MVQYQPPATSLACASCIRKLFYPTHQCVSVELKRKEKKKKLETRVPACVAIILQVIRAPISVITNPLNLLKTGCCLCRNDPRWENSVSVVHLMLKRLQVLSDQHAQGCSCSPPVLSAALACCREAILDLQNDCVCPFP